MQISKELEWLREYILLAQPHLPKRKKISKVRRLKIDGRYGKKEQAFLITSDYKTYRIYFHTMRFARYMKKPEPYTKIDILGLLAHELAHMISMDHTPRHKKLEAKLLSIFMTRLALKGYISEEEEIREYELLAS